MPYIIDGFKFGGMVRYCHTHMYAMENLVDFNLVVERHTAKPSNFQLYGILYYLLGGVPPGTLTVVMKAETVEKPAVT